MPESEPVDRDAPTPPRREAWTAPKLVPLDKLSQTEKLSYNTEHGLISGLS